MAELHAALTDLAPLDADPAADAAPPRLPALESLLARAERAPAPPDWRRWALGRLGLAAAPGDLPVGATLATAAGLDARSGTWLVATPVHLVAGLRHVQLHAAGPLPLAADAAAALAARFAREFGTDAARLHATPRGLLLQLADAVEVATCDPAPLAGRDVGGALPSGPGGPRLRRLMTELQMWLHGESPAADGGAVPINALWPWGAGREPLAGSARWPALEADDPFLDALHALDDRRVDEPGARLAAWRLASRAAADDGAGAFAGADRDFFAPLAAALSRGALARATLHVAGHEFRLRPLQRLRFWVRPRPWWELAA